MADAIETAIMGAMADAGLTETSDSGETVETVDSTTTVEPAAEAADAGAAAAAADGDEPAAASATVETVEEKQAREAAEDAELAIKPGENSIPQPRVKKMVAKATAKGEDAGRKAAAADLAARDKTISELQPYQKEYQRLNHLADNDPAAFIDALAVANPAKWKPIQARLAGAPQATGTQAPAAEGFKPATPRPKPNFKLPDGSMTYDEQGLDELLTWTSENAAAAAVAKMTKQVDERLSPIEGERKAAAFREAQRPRIAAAIKSARERWGDLFEADYQKAENGGQSEIIAYMNANPGTPFGDACTAVLLPKVRAERTKMRQDLLKEINERPAAASPGPRAAVKSAAGPRTMEQVIKDSMAAAGLE